MSSAGATLQGSFSGATGTILETGFYWGTSANSLTEEFYVDSAEGSSGSFSGSLYSLAPSTTYYYKAYVLEKNQSTGEYEYRYGSQRSFTTTAPASYSFSSNWLELPSSSGVQDFVGTFYGSGGNTDENRNYSYNYSYSWYTSLWVAYPLTGAHKTGNASTSSWAYNPKISSDKQVKVLNSSYPTMYDAADYSRGHQCPNADRKSDETMNEQTYYVTNQTPQLDNKFNGSVWGNLETAVRALVTSEDDVVYVVTGPAFRKVGGNEEINYLTGASGKNANPAKLPIPNYYWKALLKVKKDSQGNVTSACAIGFWYEHKEYASGTSFSSSTFVKSVNKIEEWTGFDLFANLPDDIEATAESNTNWQTFQNF